MLEKYFIFGKKLEKSPKGWGFCLPTPRRPPAVITICYFIHEWRLVGPLGQTCPSWFKPLVTLLLLLHKLLFCGTLRI